MKGETKPHKETKTRKPMKQTKCTFLNGALAAAIAVILVAGCDKKNDRISQADQADKKAGQP